MPVRPGRGLTNIEPHIEKSGLRPSTNPASLSVPDGHIARSVRKPRLSWQKSQGRHAGLEADQPRFSRAKWSNVGGSLKSSVHSPSRWTNSVWGQVTAMAAVSFLATASLMTESRTLTKLSAASLDTYERAVAGGAVSRFAWTCVFGRRTTAEQHHEPNTRLPRGTPRRPVTALVRAQSRAPALPGRSKPRCPGKAASTRSPLSRRWPCLSVAESERPQPPVTMRMSVMA